MQVTPRRHRKNHTVIKVEVPSFFHVNLKKARNTRYEILVLIIKEIIKEKKTKNKTKYKQIKAMKESIQPIQ